MMAESSWHRITRKVKAKYVEDIKKLWIEHGLEPEKDKSVEIGLRALVHAIYETPLGYGTFPRRDLDAIRDAVALERDFARTLFQISRKYGEKIPLKKSPEAFVEKIAEQPRWIITLSAPTKRRKTGTKLGDLKLEMLKDIEELTLRAYRIRKKKK